KACVLPENPASYRVVRKKSYLFNKAVKAVKTYTLVGTLQDDQGELLKNRFVESDISGAVINAEGVLTLETGSKNKTLLLREEGGKPPLKCSIPAADNAGNNAIRFVEDLKCSVMN
ncbi:CS1-pili formation C-terminal domain-containing protein, partial [Enterobacter hormaechei]|uniref:CS1-pili formation C-terminal domain-containing protein n=1 Tax=Enterobacter hormaechei TaxID=158836 RepID=UPI00190E48EE